ncbi:hypothetical protein PMI30_00384 [Pseudomonas sp. GM50]|nr:hypothetical protein PMI30_00384 [Pseudomonas sp. GM50]
MPTHATRLSDRQFKAVKATGKDFVLSDGDGLQLRVRASGSMIWNFNYREPLTKSRLNMALGPHPDLSLANALLDMFTPPGHHRTAVFDVIRPVVGAPNFVFIDMRQRDFDQLRTPPPRTA